MHFGRINPKFGYFIKDSAKKISELEKTNQENDLGIYLTSDIDWKDHIREVTARANKILG